MKKVCVESSYSYIKKYINYGSLLQYYALQHWLNHNGCKTYWLRFNWAHLTSAQYVQRVKLLFTATETSIKLRNVKHSFNKFVKTRLNTTPIYTRTFVLKKFPPRADIYIVGSDQVWGNYSDVNFLRFVPPNKIKASYAASFGKDSIDERYQVKAKIALEDFDGISVREKSGVEICSNLGYHAKHVLDPTLLIDSGDYPASPNRVDKSPYVLCYFLNNTQQEAIYWDRIKDVARNKQCDAKIVAVENTAYHYAMDELLYLSPEEWLAAYRDAEAIITNSFHGTVFAIIYKKPFVVITQKSKYSKQNVRMFSLLEMFGLQSRIIREDVDLKEQIDAEIDWTSVEVLLRRWRKESTQFLKDVLNKNK